MNEITVGEPMIPGKKGWDTGQIGFSTGGEGRVLEDSEVGRQRS